MASPADASAMSAPTMVAAPLRPPASSRSSTSSDDSSSPSSTPNIPPMAPIEARSLSPISAIAAKPPLQRPDPRVSSQRPSLLLWIVRIPDSKDLILTPLHPPKSTATASDIEASLYYFHYTSPHSAILIRRDPPRALQENVAVINNLGGTEVDVELTSEGWRRLGNPHSDDFTRHTPPPVVPPHREGVAHPAPRDAPKRKPVPMRQPVEAQTPPEPFKRTLTLGQGASHKDFLHLSKLKHFRRSSKELRPPLEYSKSGSSVSTVDSMLNISGDGASSQKRKKRGYMLPSPWSSTVSSQESHDMIEFQSEALGRFIKCKYYVTGQKKSSALLSVIEVAHKDGSGGMVGDNPQGRISEKHQKNGVIGMLVVHGCGFDMMDLLVASNFAVLARKMEKWQKEHRPFGG